MNKHMREKQRRWFRLRLEPLEDRTLPSVFTVTTTTDVVSSSDAAVSLREAILAANNTPNVGGPDTIAFNILGAGVHTILIPGAGLPRLPNITDAVVIDGFSQPGSSPNTNPIDQPSNALLLIELVGPSEFPLDGLFLAANGNTVRGLAMSKFGTAIYIAFCALLASWLHMFREATRRQGEAFVRHLQKKAEWEPYVWMEEDETCSTSSVTI